MVRHLVAIQQKLPRRLRRAVTALVRRTRMGRKVVWREKGVSHELDFWRRWFATKGLYWEEDYRQRLDPNALLEESLIVEGLPELGDSVSILDVGAGPLTILGKNHPEKSLTITAVDALAPEYDRLLDELGIEPPVRTRFCAGEDLLKMFPPESFDVAYARNSLDHSYDPAVIVHNMVSLVREGGFVVLRHVRREGEHQHYSGFHQWNFDVEGGHLVLWNKVARHDLTEELAGVAHVEAFRDDHGEDDWILAVIKKGEMRKAAARSA